MAISTAEYTSELERLIESQTLRSSEGLRRLLAYLAERSQSGEGDQLKEYTIGVEAFHKPPDYDPREDSTVRIQARRLRQKLDEYYQREGKDDPVIAELPKGHFRLMWSKRAPLPQATQKHDQDYVRSSSPITSRNVLLVVLLICCAVWAIFEAAQIRGYRRQLSSIQPFWTVELMDLWRPFVDTDRPLFIVVSAPTFMRSGDLFVHDKAVGGAQQVAQSKLISSISGLKLSNFKPDYRYTNFGNLTGTFLLGKLLGMRTVELSILNSNETTWQQLSEGNVLFIGASRFFAQQNQIPIEQPLILETTIGVHNLHPRAGEQSDYIDEVTADGLSGTTYSLVSHMPGPLGKGDIESFAGSTAPGIQAAVQWFTSPSSAKALDAMLRKPAGVLPAYYQVVLRVKFQDNVPIDTSYVLSRALQPHSLYDARSPAN